ncbi:MAG: twin-arginine translocase TatA/TatE family subunit [Actinobacteria bacterium]|nr:twin-arginine translocase TatA/TatE family subunit [Actinomycetota bacterium]
MFNVTGGELIIILAVALVVLGPERIPEVARSAGRMINKIKTMTEGFSSGVSDVMDDPAMKPFKELTELAANPRQKLAEYALEAEAEERAKKEAARQAADEPVATELAEAESESEAVPEQLSEPEIEPETEPETEPKPKPKPEPEPEIEPEAVVVQDP